MEEVMNLDAQQKETLNKGLERVMHQVDGRGAKARQAKQASILQTHKLLGTAPPATVINFNPVDVYSENGGLNLRVPACNAKPKPKQIVYTLGTREYVGAYITIDHPVVYPSIREVNSVEGRDEPDYDLKTCKPIAMAHELWAEANSSMTDAAAKGGVVIFEGDIHTLKKALKAERRTLRIPTFTILPDRTREYYSEEKDLEEIFAAALTRQKTYADFKIQQAQAYYTTDGQQNYIDPSHRKWGQFAIDLGWKTPTSMAWMTAMDDQAETCIGCGRTRKPGVKAFFCECGRPYNAYEAFMAGEPVGEVYLATLKGKELDDVRKEMKRRRNLFAEPKEEKKD